MATLWQHQVLGLVLLPVNMQQLPKMLGDTLPCHAGSPNKYAAFLLEVCQRTGRLVALWQAFGFVHGVLNTDNMSILGETIDYGCAQNPEP